MSNGADIDPSILEGAEFETVRRGYEPDAVRRRLRQAADEIRTLRARIGELEADLDEYRSVEPVELETRRVAELLGEETVRVLETARAAAAERVERADRESDEILAVAAASAAEITAQAEADRETVRVEAEARAEREVEEARNRGREMVNEAQTVRERMLTDLARKRQAGREQLEQLRAGRDRLLESLAHVQRSLEQSVQEMVDSVPEARAAAERAGLRVRYEEEVTAEKLEAEIEAARLVGHPLIDTTPTTEASPVEDETPFDIETLEANDEDRITHEPTVRLRAVTFEEGSEPEDESDLVDEPEMVAADLTVVEADEEMTDEAEVVDEQAEDEEAEVIDEEAEVVDEQAEVVDEQAEDDVAAVEVDEEIAEEPELEAEVAEVEPETEPEPEPEAEQHDDAGEEVDDLFARLRSSRAAAVESAAAVLDLTEADAAAVGVASEATDEAVTEDIEDEADEEADDLEYDEVEVDDVDDELALLAMIIEEAVNSTASALQRALVDEQGELLDGLRVNGMEALELVMVDADSHDSRFHTAVNEPLLTVCEQWAPGLTIDLTTAYVAISEELTGPLRAGISRTIETSDDADDASRAIRRLYRETRGRRLADAAAAAVEAARAETDVVVVVR